MNQHVAASSDTLAEAQPAFLHDVHVHVAAPSCAPQHRLSEGKSLTPHRLRVGVASCHLTASVLAGLAHSVNFAERYYLLLPG